jgi:hypothetical protein
VNYGRRKDDSWLLKRAQLAGVFGMMLSLLQASTAWADISQHAHAIIESISTAIIFIGSAALVLIRDPRCAPKIERINTILIRALAKHFGVRDDGDLRG